MCCLPNQIIVHITRIDYLVFSGLDYNYLHVEDIQCTKIRWLESITNVNALFDPHFHRCKTLCIPLIEWEFGFNVPLYYSPHSQGCVYQKPSSLKTKWDPHIVARVSFSLVFFLPQPISCLEAPMLNPFNTVIAIWFLHMKNQVFNWDHANNV